jgi:hypothetical protein
MSHPEHARHADLTGGPAPCADWHEPTDRLVELYERAEREALATMEWYLESRQRKRRAARALRGGMLAGLAVGAGLPLLAFTGAGGGGGGGALAGWGYLALLGAGLCAASDRCFGLSSGWMRDMAVAQAVRRRLEALRYDWAAESVREVLGPAEGSAGDAAERCLWVLRRFSEDLAELVRAETADWMVEFRSAPGPLPAQIGLERGHREERYGECPAVGGARFAPLPGGGGGGGRANMPRQRPPEGPRP